MDYPILSYLIFFPLVGVVLLLFLGREKEKLLKGITLGVTFVEFIFSLPLAFNFRAEMAGMQFSEYVDWIPTLGIAYRVGLDGISLWLVLLTTFLSVIAVLACWEDIKLHVKEFLICLLLLETGMVGVFVALDVFFFYLFWLVMLVPLYFLIGVWGNPARRIYAAMKFVLFTLVGSLLMLVAILYIYFYHHSVTGQYTFDLMRWYELSLPHSAQLWLFLAFGLAFAIKVPMFPFHTWLPDAHTEAPTVVSVLLAAVLLKMGTYGFLRYNLPLFPETSIDFVPVISILAIIGIIYGALVAMVQVDVKRVQVDVKRLVAYSSVSHLGFVMLGLFTFNLQGIEGGIIQMINHGLSTGALFLLVGMLYERRHTRMIAEFGGLSRVMPIYATFFMIVTLSSIGLPGLNGFVGEFLILLGTFRTNVVYAVFAATGVILAAVYMLWMFQRVMFGEVTNPKNEGLSDMTK
ncbi:MAG: NADH-quinone oxidoreductase subunit M, partial [Deltaproteobacteria bacterium]|nr:NADH-quinone oxidoreductase subunit M [Deltaproteobacteria bacterium]